jgi:hypothetical protein
MTQLTATTSKDDARPKGTDKSEDSALPMTHRASCRDQLLCLDPLADESSTHPSTSTRD